jgi:hypothetical protein
MDNEIVPPILMTATSALSGLVYGPRRRSVGMHAAVAAGCSVWSGTQVLIFMVPHTVVSTTMRILGKSKAMSLVNAKIAGVDYDFRLYSLALVGILFIMQAVSILRASRAASEGEFAASKRLRRSIWNVLLLAIPLAPISPGIPFLTAPAILALVTQYLLFAHSHRLEGQEAQARAAAV